MSGIRAVTTFALLLAIFLAIDAVWLTLAGPYLYRPAIGHLMREDFSIGAAALFYLLYVAGLLYFVIQPAHRARDAGKRGALFGLIAYATYDLTNQATLQGWPWHVTVADLAWGALVTGTSCAIAHRLAWRQIVD
jgi:uncharacterized membrane protein